METKEILAEIIDSSLGIISNIDMIKNDSVFFTKEGTIAFTEEQEMLHDLAREWLARLNNISKRRIGKC